MTLSDKIPDLVIVPGPGYSSRLVSSSLFEVSQLFAK
jgi:hypothetical protein